MVLNDSDNAIDIDAIKNLYESVVSVKQINVVSGNAIEEKKSILANKSRAAKLWINYIKYIQVCRNFIWASRPGDWHLHLHSASQMMNLFAATGHHNYAKSTQLGSIGKGWLTYQNHTSGFVNNSQMKVCLFVEKVIDTGQGFGQT